MSFFGKIFGNKNSNQGQNNFVVDEDGNAQQFNDSNQNLIEKKPVVSQNQNPVTNQKQNDVEPVGDTSAFEELMEQAEQSVESKVLEHPIVDPEFEKATQEISKEEGIEIFPAE